MDSDKYEKILILIKLFNNRPNLLTKYLITHKAFNEDFLDKLLNNKKIEEMSKNNIINNETSFDTIADIEDYYNSFLEINGKTKSEITKELNNKLTEALKNERYEDASKIRDYMKKNNIEKT